MSNLSDTRGKLFSLLPLTKYTKENLLLPTPGTNASVVKHTTDDTNKKDSDETQLKEKSFPPSSGYIKYPSYDFF